MTFRKSYILSWLVFSWRIPRRLFRDTSIAFCSSFPWRCMPHGFRDTFHDAHAFHDTFSMTLHTSQFPWHLSMTTFPWHLFPWQLFSWHSTDVAVYDSIFPWYSKGVYACLCVSNTASMQATTAIPFLATSLLVSSVFVWLMASALRPPQSLSWPPLLTDGKWVTVCGWRCVCVTLWVTLCGWRCVTWYV